MWLISKHSHFIAMCLSSPEVWEFRIIILLLYSSEKGHTYMYASMIQGEIRKFMLILDAVSSILLLLRKNLGLQNVNCSSLKKTGLF